MMQIRCQCRIFHRTRWWQGANHHLTIRLQLGRDMEANMPEPPGNAVSEHCIPDGFGNDKPEMRASLARHLLLRR